MRVHKHILAAAVIFATAAASAAGVSLRAQAARQPVDVSKLGPQVGQTAPEFTLEDQNGKPQTLASIMGPSGAMLVFFRSADW